MAHEIDFLAVGEESSGGDAIALRYGNLSGPRVEQTVIIIDGGYKQNGEALVEFVKSRYGTDVVDIVVSTHPDQDHSSGLEVVLENLTVQNLLMHLPWKHSSSIEQSKASSFTSLANASEKLQKSLSETSTLEQIANRKGIPIIEPFTGVQTTDGVFRVVGPSEPYYETVLAEMIGVQSLTQRMAQVLRQAKAAVLKFVDETLHIETLRDDGVTRPSNNSSVIAVLDVDGQRSLFTGDAGIPALERALDVLESDGHIPGAFKFVQVPHHGSRRNVGPSVLNRLLGQLGQDTTHSTAFVSSPKKNPEEKHPSKKVANAFHRRGYAVHKTSGINKWHHRGDVPARSDYSTSTPEPFHYKVEDDED